MVDLGAYDEPVPFDDDTADALKAAATGLAQTLRDQAGARQGWADTALTEFKGHYADVFRSNAQATHDDCTNIASALDALATDVQTMKQAAADERTRRQKAKKWAEDQKNDF